MYTLHYSPDTAALAPHLVLAELGVPFELRLIDRAHGGLDSPAYRRLQPLGQIPAMETPDGPMFESGAILLWLSERHPGLAPAPQSPERAAFLKWFVFANNSVHTTLMQVFYPERVAGAECAPEVLAVAVPKLRHDLTLIDRMVAAEAPRWLSPDRPGVMGYYLGQLIRWLSCFDADHPCRFSAAEFPALLPILTMLENRPAALEVARIHALGPTIFTNPAF